MTGVRLATVDDARRIAEVHVRARRSAYRDLIPEQVLAKESVELRSRLWTGRLADERSRCWLLADGVDVFGFAHTSPARDRDLGSESAELVSLYLLSEKTGSGFGRLITAHAIADLETRGFFEVVLWHAMENTRAAQFYAAAGFEPDPRTAVVPFGDTGLTKRRLRRLLR